jgi:uncharacterized protein YceK
MMSGQATMRTFVILTLVTALGGCYSIRHRNDPDVLAATGQAPDTPKGKKAKAAKEAKATREVLPTGLAGDREHHAYTDTPQ